MTHDPTAGDLGRVALNDDPTATALRLARWCSSADECERIARWYREMAFALDALVLDKAGDTVPQP